MRGTNWLSNIFDWLGDALERFNPSAFRFLAAVLPYLTPVPVAWLTAHSSSLFLHFTPTVAFIFVFALEGIGLWFTTMLVDAIVDWVRSKNWKSFVPVILFSVTVYAYVSLLVSLNVTLESASGVNNPVLSKVITLLCFLPLITGVGNGYYKLKLEYKTESQALLERQERLERDEKDRKERVERDVRRERREERLERLRIKQETYQKVSSKSLESYQKEESDEKVSSNLPTDWRKIRPSLNQEQVQFIAKNEPKDIVQAFHESQIIVSPRTASNWKVYAMKELGLDNSQQEYRQ